MNAHAVMKSIVVLISGRGSNLQSILDAGLAMHVRAVISNNPQAKGLEIAKRHGITTYVIDHNGFSSREAFDHALANKIDTLQADLIVLAGFMRILSDDFVNRYPNRLVNIHPSLLPAFTGLNTHRRALVEGVKIHGCTVHFVTCDLDVGPIIVQAAVVVYADDTEESLAERVLEQEHIIYPMAIRWIVEDKLKLIDKRVHINQTEVAAAALISPYVRKRSE